MTDKRFYWIKLKTDFFSRSDIDFLLSQQNGCQYVVLYQMLCLSTANNEGKLFNKIGEVIVPDRIINAFHAFAFVWRTIEHQDIAVLFFLLSVGADIPKNRFYSSFWFIP